MCAFFSRQLLLPWAWLLLAGLPAQAHDMTGATPATPLLQATAGAPACPAPMSAPPAVDEQRAQAHYRAERGTSCYQSGRCRLPNSYLYDAEIVPRVKKALLAHGGFEDTSIWIDGQRRWVWLKGCVRSRSQAAAAEQLIRSLDDVEAVISELVVTGEQPAH